MNIITCIALAVILGIGLLIATMRQNRVEEKLNQTDEGQDKIALLKSEYLAIRQKNKKMILHWILSIASMVLSVYLVFIFKVNDAAVILLFPGVIYFLVSCVLVLSTTFAKANLIPKLKAEKIDYKKL